MNSSFKFYDDNSLDSQASDEWVSGKFKDAKSLYQRIANAGGANSGPVSCSEPASNIQKSGGAVSGITVLGLGIKCEDDNQATWVCDDDAVYIVRLPYLCRVCF